MTVPRVPVSVETRNISALPTRTSKPGRSQAMAARTAYLNERAGSLFALETYFRDRLHRLPMAARVGGRSSRASPTRRRGRLARRSPSTPSAAPARGRTGPGTRNPRRKGGQLVRPVGGHLPLSILEQRARVQLGPAAPPTTQPHKTQAVRLKYTSTSIFRHAIRRSTVTAITWRWTIIFVQV